MSPCDHHTLAVARGLAHARTLARSHPRTPFGLLLALASLAAACGHVTYTPPRPVRIAVMPFDAPESITQQPFDIRGWWFGSHDVRQSRNVSAWTAESLARELQALDCVEVIPPYDMRRYLLEQQRTLMQAHPDLSREQVLTLLREVPLADYGRDLEVDKIITGRVVESRLSHNRTIDVWNSAVDFKVQIWDVDDLVAAEQSGDVQTPEYEEDVSAKEWFASWLAATDEAFRELAARMRRTYFGNPRYFRNL
jgi:hypothetical protein